MGKYEGKRPLGRPRIRWEKNIKMSEVGWSLDWINLAQDRDRRRVLLSALMNLPVPQNVG